MTSGGKQGRYEPVMGAMAMPLSEEDMADLAAYYASLPISNIYTWKRGWMAVRYFTQRATQSAA